MNAGRWVREMFSDPHTLQAIINLADRGVPWAVELINERGKVMRDGFTQIGITSDGEEYNIVWEPAE